MTDRAHELERRLRERRHKEAAARCLRVLENVGIELTEDDILPLSEVDRIWPAYINELRAKTSNAERFAANDHEGLQGRLDEIADRVGEGSAIWLAFIDSEPVGIEAPAEPLLRAASTFLVSSAADLMLTSRSLEDGIAVELNHLPSGDEFELAAWGVFATKA